MAYLANIEDVKRKLRKVAPGKSTALDELFQEVAPTFAVDTTTDELLFRCFTKSRVILVGMEATKRLQVHCVAGAIVLLTEVKFNTGEIKEPLREERNRLADRILNWAVPRDIRDALRKSKDIDVSPEEILKGSGDDLPHDILGQLLTDERIHADGYFDHAAAFILLHELGHLKLGHEGLNDDQRSRRLTAEESFWSLQEERDADWFAAEWLIEGTEAAGRLGAIVGIAMALLWLSIKNVFLGPLPSQTHPQSYDRLYQILNRCLAEQSFENRYFVWKQVFTLLFLHMDAAGYPFDRTDFQNDDPRDDANVLIDKISKFGRCPYCHQATLELLDTIATSEDSVTRHYQCRNHECLKTLENTTTK